MILRLASLVLSTAALCQGFNIELHQPLQRPTSSLFVSLNVEEIIGNRGGVGVISPQLLQTPIVDALVPPSIMDEIHLAEEEATVTETPASVIHLTWETDVEQQIRAAVQQRINHPLTDGTPATEQPYMVAVVGIPGSGKSTSCSILTGLLRDVGCLLMPFDGYHYPVETLKTFENPQDALYRRGAPDTFDVEALYRDLSTMRTSYNVPQVLVPGFDHAAGDPEPNAHEFDRASHKVIVCEGLYLLHDDNEWDKLKNLFDLTIFVNANVDVCVDRLKERNKCIPGYTPEEIEIRCDQVDRVNAETVQRSQKYANLIVESAATFAPVR